MNIKAKWLSLFATNFLGVMNNNFLRNLIVFVYLFFVSKEHKEFIVTLASGLYVMPYIFFSPIGGRLAKTQKKSKIMFISKLCELPVFILACVGLVFHSIYIVLFCVFAVGLISTLFSPSKYGLIRDIGGDEGISFGTGTLEMLTFFGVLLGTFIASIISDHYSHILFASILISVALIQLFTSSLLKNIKETKTIEVKNDTLNPLKFLINSFKWANTIPTMNFIILGLSTFWMLGNFILMNLMVHCDKTLGMSNTQTGIVMTIAAVGIGLGSFITGLLSNKKVELGFTPIGAFGMLICFFILFALKPNGFAFSVTIFLTSFFSGMYMVPLSSWVQHSVEGRLQGDMLAYSNFTIFLFNLISAVVFGPIVAIFSTNAIWILLFLIVISVTFTMLYNVSEMGNRTLKLLKIK